MRHVTYDKNYVLARQPVFPVTVTCHLSPISPFRPVRTLFASTIYGNLRKKI
jgi:hypothetical protein